MSYYADRYIEFMSSSERIQNDPSDVYATIKSLEIRNFFKNHIRLNVLEREKIILKSDISMQQKISMIKQLALYGSEQDAALLNEHCGILKKCMADIYHPAQRTIFILEYVEPYFEDCRIKKNRYLNGAFDTIEEVLCKAESDLKNIEMQRYGSITLLQVPRSGKRKNLFDFTISWIDDSWQVKDIMLDEKYLLSCGFSKKAVEYLLIWSFVSLEHFPLPFEEKSQLKLQTPFMEEPFYGILDSGCGYMGEWHHYLWDKKIMTSIENVRDLYTRENMKNCVSLSYMELSLYSGYSTLDWVERV